MDRSKQCNQIIEKYYYEILNRCRFLLQDDLQDAEDCVHDVFVLLLLKRNEIDLDRNIRGWLYACADRVVKDYRKKRQRQMQMQTALDQHAELQTNGAFYDGESFTSSAFDCLSEQEVQILKEYYSAEKGSRGEIAKKHGMTMKELYRCLYQMREKIRKYTK